MSLANASCNVCEMEKVGYVDTKDVKYYEKCHMFVPKSKNKAKQTAKQTESKLDLTLVSPYLIEGVAEVRSFGTKKYGDPDNWKKVAKHEWVKAMFRHFLKILKGEKYDQESGLSHWKHIGCNVNFILETEAMEND